MTLAGTYICPFGCRNPIWNPTVLIFFFSGGIPNGIPRLFSVFPVEWNPRRIPNGFFGILSTIIGISYELLFIFWNPIFILCFSDGISNCYLGRQKLVRLLVSETSLFYTIRLNTDVYRYLFFKYNILV